MKTLIKTSQLLFLLTYMGGCATMQRWANCDREAAFKQGYRAVITGDLNKSSRKAGDVCTEEYSKADYAKDYERGFQQSFYDRCSPMAAAKGGALDVQNGNSDMVSIQKYAICKSHPKYQGAQNQYVEAFKYSMCRSDHMADLGETSGSRIQSPEVSSYLRHCRFGSRANLQSAYMAAYRVAIRRACDYANQSVLGIQAARNGEGIETGISRLQNCPMNLKSKSIRHFTRSYQMEKEAIHAKKMLQLQKERVAQRTEALRLEALAQKRRNRELRQARIQQNQARVRARQLSQRVKVANNYRPDSISSECKLKRRKALVKIKNKSGSTLMGTTDFKVKFLGRKKAYLGEKNLKVRYTLKPYGNKIIEVSGREFPKAKKCKID